eukprot:Platyproteum_vivax@DN2448_c0_g1_i1.p1
MQVELLPDAAKLRILEMTNELPIETHPSFTSSQLSVNHLMLDFESPSLTSKIVVSDRFTDPDVLRQCVTEAGRLFEQGDNSRPGGMGKDTSKWLDRSMRGDEIIWIQQVKGLPGFTALLNSINAVRQELEDNIGFSLTRSEMQLTKYPANGSRYERHYDASPTNNRLFTFIVYLNEKWQLQDGGYLRAYLPGVILDMPPEFNTCVLFKSKEIEHEVRPCHRTRYAVSCWFSKQTQ